MDAETVMPVIWGNNICVFNGVIEKMFKRLNNTLVRIVIDSDDSCMLTG